MILSTGIQSGVSRSAAIRPSLDGEQFEIVVIGGGINGVAIARECARAGRSVLLLEQNDFASGTTSRSTRIIHGGLRYLQYAEISLVRESLHDRDRLVRERPHLVHPMRFVLALDEVRGASALQIRAGLWLYRKLAGSHWNSPQSSALRTLEQELDTGRNWSIFEYDDAQCEFPERLVAEWMFEAVEAGAIVRNYSQVLDIQHTTGRATGLRFRDRLSSEECEVSCQWIVNATGPWVDQVCADASIPTGGPLIGGVRGTHLVVPVFSGAPDSALYTQASDGRVIFIIPWNRQILVGTTEIPDTGDPSRTAPTAAEVEYLLGSVNRLFPRAGITLSDIQYAFAGVRPLPYMEDVAPSAVTRKSILYDHKQDGVPGMISIIGGKLTTAASLARRVATALRIKPEPLPKVTVPIGNASGIQTVLRHWAQSLSRGSGVGEDTVMQIASIYGPRTPKVVALASYDERMLRPLCDHTKHVVAEAIYAIRSECAITMADVLLRRVPVGLGPCWSAECSRTAVARIGIVLGWNESECESQAEALDQERNDFLRKPEAMPTPEQSSSGMQSSV